MHPKAYLVKVNHETCQIDVIEVPRWMPKRKRDRFNRYCKTKLSDYVFTVSGDIEKTVWEMMKHEPV